MESLGLIVSYLLIGWVLQRTRSLPDTTGLVLNQYVIYVAVPAMILLYLPRLQLGVDVLAPVITPWVLYLSTLVFIYTLSRLLRWEPGVTGALMVIVPLGNTAFLGFPFIEAFYGEQGLPYAVIYDQVGSFLALALVGSVIAAHYAQQVAQKAAQQTAQQDSETLSKHFQPKSLTTKLKDLIKFPPVLALLFAVTLGQAQYPVVIQPLLEHLAATLVPVVMIAVGFQLQLRIATDDKAPFFIALGTKLILMPLVALLGFKLLGVNSLAAQVSIMEAAMPPMVTGGALAMSAGLKPRLVAAIIGYGILAGVISLPIMHAFSQWTLFSL